MNEYYGHVTMDDGSHVPLTKEQAETILKQVEDAGAKRAAAMPTEPLRRNWRGLWIRMLCAVYGFNEARKEKS